MSVCLCGRPCAQVSGMLWDILYCVVLCLVFRCAMPSPIIYVAMLRIAGQAKGAGRAAKMLAVSRHTHAQQRCYIGRQARQREGTEESR